MSSNTIRGRAALEHLASVYPQLYLVPGTPGCEETYKDIVLRGKDAPGRDLSYFMTNGKDSLEIVETPAGPVPVLTLYVRQDYERFLTIIANHCKPEVIPATQGASALNGIINWQKIRAHEAAWMKERSEAGDSSPDWGEEFARFTSVRENYQDALIVLSAGPYSNVPGSRFGIAEDEWIRDSLIIRKYHECNHFYCRRKYRELIDAIWDEVVSDAIGIIAAFGKLDVEMEEAFLGISETGYEGGRLENYTPKDETIHKIARKIHGVLLKIRDLQEESGITDPFLLADLLEARKAEWWD